MTSGSEDTKRVTAPRAARTTAVAVEAATSQEREEQEEGEPSMSMALLIYWVVPVLILAIVSRYFVDTSVPEIPGVEKGKHRPGLPRSLAHREQLMQARSPSTPRRSAPVPAAAPAALSRQPTSYQELVEVIASRRRKSYRRREFGSASPQPQPVAAPSANPAAARTGPASDPQRARLVGEIDRLRRAHEDNPTDLFQALEYADAMRFYDLQFHDGGTYERASIDMYRRIVALAEAQRQRLRDAGEPTARPGVPVAEEVTVEYREKSADGLLCAIYVAQGKVLYMANMFENAERSYSHCLRIAPDYLDALNARGSTYIILGQYAAAAEDFQAVVAKDLRRLFPDAFTGLARVLAAKEDATAAGWDGLVPVAERLLPTLEHQLEANPQGKSALANILNRLHHALFTYHDVKTNDTDKAWRHLTESYKHKMSILPPWNKGFERKKVNQSKEIFVKGFWPTGVGSETDVPVFIIGFVRSGSTLLERVLDAHPMIVGTGENSVFNGRLDSIRNRIVETSVSAVHRIADVTKELANEVVDEMRRRWEILEGNKEKAADEPQEDPKRFVDKMLTNYYNVGFIHMLYPNAVILHVFREPMDTIFSAYKHEFPSGTLDYTSEFEGLAELYHSYRDIMEHWDNVLPGRILHVRYEDMVSDMPGMARAIIDAVGLPWDEGVLDFHKKKHAVNTLSSIQVRKGVYKDSLQSWRRYETHLHPLVELIGERTIYSQKTTLPGYKPSDELSQDRDEL